MIEIWQWRMTIGCFAGGGASTPTTRGIRTMVTFPRSWYGITFTGLLLCTYSLIVVAILLLCSGNVELNPGPVNCKTCPFCLDKKVPIKLKVCNCGHVFHKKSRRQPPRYNSIPLTDYKLVTSDSDPIRNPLNAIKEHTESLVQFPGYIIRPRHCTAVLIRDQVCGHGKRLKTCTVKACTVWPKLFDGETFHC